MRQKIIKRSAKFLSLFWNIFFVATKVFKEVQKITSIKTKLQFIQKAEMYALKLCASKTYKILQRYPYS